MLWKNILPSSCRRSASDRMLHLRRASPYGMLPKMTWRTRHWTSSSCFVCQCTYAVFSSVSISVDLHSLWNIDYCKLIVRWKRDDAGRRVSHRASDKPILQFVSVRRKDSGEWALPGVSSLSSYLLCYPHGDAPCMRNVSLIQFLIFGTNIYILFACLYCMLLHLSIFSSLFPYLSPPLLIFSDENKPAPFTLWRLMSTYGATHS